MRRVFRKMFAVTIASSVLVVACGWDPTKPFERESPEVNEALGYFDAGDAAKAGTVLEEYLSTGQCKEGNIGTPPRVRERANGGFDLGLALFRIAEAYGRRFGEEEYDGGPATGLPSQDKDKDEAKSPRVEEVACALHVVRAIAEDRDQPIELRARARYLEGNLLFLDGEYEEAVKAYDAALELAPGMHDAGPIAVGDASRTYVVDPVGRDAAWNRAIALRRIEDKKKDSGSDAASDASPDSGGDGGGQGKDKKNDKNDKKDSGSDQKDSGGDDQNKPKPDDKKKEPPPPPPPSATSRQSQDDRMLDQLENAPTVQQEAAKKQAQKRRVRGIQDK